MFKKRRFLLLPSILLFLFFAGCSPKVKIALWVKNHQEAASALETWGASHPMEALTLFNLDCSDRNQFKQKITDALNTPSKGITQQNNNVAPKYYPYSNPSNSNRENSFADWCRKYPASAKKLRSHAKALCKAGLGILSGSIKMK